MFIQFQYGLCDPCSYHYDFILKLETLQDDTEFVLEEVSPIVLKYFDHIIF